MNQSYQSSHSNLLVLSDCEEGKTSLRYEQFTNQWNPIHSIPQVQLQEIHTGTTQLQKQKTNVHPLQANSMLYYADKLAINHNILKELLHMIDSKVTFRYSDTTVTLSSNKTQPCQDSASDKIKQNNPPKQHLTGRMEEKMLQIRQRLTQTIELINKELSAETSNRIKKIINMENIRENPSEAQLSLEYSRQFQYGESKKSNVEKSLRSRQNQQQQKEDNIQKPEKKDALNIEDQEYTNIGENINQSIKRRREMQSGEANEKDTRYQEVNSSLKDQILQKDYEIKKDDQSNQKINKPNLEQIYSYNDLDDDETGRIIQSTINKKKINTKISPANSKIIRSSILSPISQTNSESEGPNDSTLVTDIKKNKFWKDRQSNFQFYNKKTVVSREQIEQSKAIQKPNKETFTFERKRSKEKVEFKLEHLHNIHEKQATKMKAVKQPFQATLNNSQLIYSQEEYAIQSEQTQQNQFSRFPLPYTLPSRTDFNQLKKPELYSLKPLQTNIRQQKRESAPNPREATVVGSSPRIFKPQAAITSQPNYYVDNRSHQLHQNGRPLQIFVNNTQNYPISSSLHTNSEQRHIIFNKPVGFIDPAYERIPPAVSRPVSVVRPSSVRLKSANYTNNFPVRPYLRQSNSDLGPLLSLNKVQNKDTNIMRAMALQQMPPSNPQFARTVYAQNKSVNLFKVGVVNRKFNFSKAQHINNDHIPKQENILQRTSIKQPQLAHRQINSKSIIDHLVPRSPVQKPTVPQQNNFNRLKQASTASKQISAGFRYQSIKKQLQKIAETSEESIHNSAMKRNEMNSKNTSNYLSPRTNSRATSPKIKKTGIYITNQISNRIYLSQPSPSQ